MRKKKWEPKRRSKMSLWGNRKISVQIYTNRNSQYSVVIAFIWQGRHDGRQVSMKRIGGEPEPYLILHHIRYLVKWAKTANWSIYCYYLNIALWFLERGAGGRGAGAGGEGTSAHQLRNVVMADIFTAKAIKHIYTAAWMIARTSFKSRVDYIFCQMRPNDGNKVPHIGAIKRRRRQTRLPAISNSDRTISE